MNDIQSPAPLPHDPLSDAGQLRRDQMLPQLQGAMQDWHHRRRRNRRTALAVVPVSIMALGAIWWRMSPVSTPPKSIPVAIDVDTSEIVVPRQVLIVDRVATNPALLDRFRVDEPSSIEIIDDSSLLALLAEMDRPTGLIATGGEIRLTRNVVDPLAPSPSPGS